MRPVSGESFVNKSMQLLSLTASAAVLFAVISWGGVAHAQQTSPKSGQAPSQSAPPPDNSQQSPSQTQPSQPPDQQAPSTRQGQAEPGQTPDQAQSDANGSKEFVGTVVKQGNKYMFQEASSGQTYDIDHQEEVKKFDGKKVRVRGTLDPQTKTIHVQ